MTSHATRPNEPTAGTNRWAHEATEADPWSAMSLIISGVLLWGMIGWGVSVWLNTRLFMGLGVVIGGVLGVVLVYLRYGRDQSGPPATVGPVAFRGPAADATDDITHTADPTAVPTLPFSAAPDLDPKEDTL